MTEWQLKDTILDHTITAPNKAVAERFAEWGYEIIGTTDASDGRQTPDDETPELNISLGEETVVLFEADQTQIGEEPTHWIQTDTLLSPEDMR